MPQLAAATRCSRCRAIANPAWQRCMACGADLAAPAHSIPPAPTKPGVPSPLFLRNGHCLWRMDADNLVPPGAAAKALAESARAAGGVLVADGAVLVVVGRHSSLSGLLAGLQAHGGEIITLLRGESVERERSGQVPSRSSGAC